MGQDKQDDIDFNWDKSTSRSKGLLLKIIHLLRLLEQRPSNIYFLVQTLNLSKRQIMRYISIIKQAGIPIEYNRYTTEWSINSKQCILPLELSQMEILAILTLFDEYGKQTGEHVFSALKTAIIKSSLFISPTLSDCVQQIHKFVHLKNPVKDYKKDRSGNPDNKNSFHFMFKFILKAIEKGQTLSIQYKSPLDPQPVEMTLNPYALLFVRSWYVIGYAGLYHQIRTFKINRLLSITSTETLFQRPFQFSLDQYLGNAWKMIPEPVPDEIIIIRFSKLVSQNVAEVKWHRTQETRWLPDGRVELSFLISGLNEILWWILGYGAEAEVIQPLRLRDMVLQHVKQMRELYQDSPPVH